MPRRRRACHRGSDTRGQPAEARPSHGQQMLWYAHQFAPTGAAYHIAGAGLVRAELDLDALLRAFRRVVDRHEALRSTFPAVDDAPVLRLIDAEDIQAKGGAMVSSRRTPRCRPSAADRPGPPPLRPGGRAPLPHPPAEAIGLRSRRPAGLPPHHRRLPLGGGVPRRPGPGLRRGSRGTAGDMAAAAIAASPTSSAGRTRCSRARKGNGSGPTGSGSSPDLCRSSTSRPTALDRPPQRPGPHPSRRRWSPALTEALVRAGRGARGEPVHDAAGRLPGLVGAVCRPGRRHRRLAGGGTDPAGSRGHGRLLRQHAADAGQHRGRPAIRRVPGPRAPDGRRGAGAPGLPLQPDGRTGSRAAPIPAGRRSSR